MSHAHEVDVKEPDVVEVRPQAGTETVVAKINPETQRAEWNRAQAEALHRLLSNMRAKG